MFHYRSSLTSNRLEYANLCVFTNKYYCASCHSGKQHPIPWKIFTACDFHSYPVCNTSFNFLAIFGTDALLNAQLFSQDLRMQHRDATMMYIFNQLSVMHSVRKLLVPLARHVMQCPKMDVTAFRKQIWPREYILELPDSLSLNDLLALHTSAVHYFPIVIKPNTVS